MTEKSVLHCCGGAIKSLFAELFNALHQAGIRQQIYIPVRKKEQLNYYHALLPATIPCSYALLIKPYHRYLYRLKINTLYKYLLKQDVIQTVGIVHSHSLFSDGGIALQLYKDYQISYITTVTNTDINYYFRYAIHLRKHGLLIAEKASYIVFHNPAYREYFIKQFFKNTPLQTQIASKSVVIPIGISPTWFAHRQSPKKSLKLNQLHFLYVGDFSKNKNVEKLIALITYQQQRGIDWKLTLAGGNAGNVARIKHLVSQYAFIQQLDWIENEEALREAYRQADVFIMLSEFETFGKVYIEALTQGLPIIYTKGQGVDGFFEENPIGLAIPFESTISYMAQEISHFIERYNQRDDIDAVFDNTLELFNPMNLLNQWINLYD